MMESAIDDFVVTAHQKAELGTCCGGGCGGTSSNKKTCFRFPDELKEGLTTDEMDFIGQVFSVLSKKVVALKSHSSTSQEQAAMAGYYALLKQHPEPRRIPEAMSFNAEKALLPLLNEIFPDADEDQLRVAVKHSYAIYYYKFSHSNATGEVQVLQTLNLRLPDQIKA